MSKRSRKKRRGASTRASAQNTASPKAVDKPAVAYVTAQAATPVEKTLADCPLVQLGSTLREGREALGLSLEDVAEKSLVHTRFIQCLEMGKDPGVAPTYVRGYLRLLAEHLNLPPANLLALFDEAQNPQTEIGSATAGESQAPAQRDAASDQSGVRKVGALGSLLRHTRIALRSEKQADKRIAVTVPGAHPESATGAQKHLLSSEQGNPEPATESVKADGRPAPKAIMRNGTAWQTPSILHTSAKRISLQTIALPMIGLLLVAAYYASDSDPIRAGSVVVEASSEPLGKLASTALDSELSAAPAEDRALVPLNREERQAALAGLDNQQPSESAAPVASRVAAIESTVSPSIQSSEADEGESVRSIINVGAISARSQVERNAAAPLLDSYEPVGPGAEYMISQQAVRDRLVISVYEDSWVDVRDANGVRLYRDLAKAGRRIDLSGQLPFSLHVGNAPGLALELNGNYVPIERYRSDNSARLTLATNAPSDGPQNRP